LPEELRAAAAVGADDQTRRTQACHAAFHIAEYGLTVRHDLSQSDARKGDEKLLHEAVETCPLQSITHAAALADLKRLQ
jgi:ferredoxin